MFPWLHLGPLAISTYSLMFLLAFIVGGYVTYREAVRQHRATEEMLQVALGALAGGVIGAKLIMILFLGPQNWIHDLPVLWYSGQAWTGGFFGGYAGVVIVKRWRKITYATGDVFVVALPLAQAIGRLGNLLGGDPFGLPTTLPWGIVQNGVKRQPTALYEMILDLALFFVILRLRDKLPKAGDLFKFYIVAYCSLRFLLDFTRDDIRYSFGLDPHVFAGLTMVQILYGAAIPTFGYQLWRSYHPRVRPAMETQEAPSKAA